MKKLISRSLSSGSHGQGQYKFELPTLSLLRAWSHLTRDTSDSYPRFSSFDVGGESQAHIILKRGIPRFQLIPLVFLPFTP